MSSLSVYSVLWGDKYEPGYVYALKEMVRKNLTVEHEFYCITDQDLPGINTIMPIVNWHAWWQKLQLFRIASGPSLYFDLDVVITANINYMAELAKCDFCAPANWAQSGHGGIQSSVMAWNGKYQDPYFRFKYEANKDRLWGDQEFLTELRGDDFYKMTGVGSYKYHVRGKNGGPLPRIVCFHGKPDYPEVDEEWIREATGAWYL